MNHAQKARELFLSGCSCSQAVFAAFADDFGMDQDTALKLASSFGGGMGRLREVCGAASGMFAVAGLLKGYDDPKAKEEKAEHYALIQNLAGEFKKENGMSIRAYCNDLKLEDAKKLLLHTDSSVTEIAFDVGFHDASYFIFLFKKRFGLSPLQFRRKNAPL